MRKDTGIQVDFDQDWIKDYQIEEVTISPYDVTSGVVIVSSTKMDIAEVKLFEFKISKYHNKIKVTNELLAFSFSCEEDKSEFLQLLPEMSAMDLVFLLNTEPESIYN